MCDIGLIFWLCIPTIQPMNPLSSLLGIVMVTLWVELPIGAVEAYGPQSMLASDVNVVRHRSSPSFCLPRWVRLTLISFDKLFNHAGLVVAVK